MYGLNSDFFIAIPGTEYTPLSTRSIAYNYKSSASGSEVQVRTTTPLTEYIHINRPNPPTIYIGHIELWTSQAEALPFPPLYPINNSHSHLI